MSALIDLVNQRFGTLVVISRAPNRVGKSMWLCQCDCGRTSFVISDNLRRGRTRSCGCRQNVSRHPRTFKHGYSKMPEYKVWMTMVDRCENPKSTSYHKYGARGIKVCDRWHDFANFLQDMGRRPPKLTLERVDNNGPYDPSNCRWDTHQAQANNKRNSRFFEHVGLRLTLAQWARRLNFKVETLRQRIKSGWSTDVALTTPLLSQNR